uniref:Uncharacterized protein n=1 Tax=Myotis myotis TaxID=51298 RepID=A0A7J7YEW1_MYOMY|nr:hypothetical protein mMyoMyo1_011119 [Myotis myotis]
MSGSCTQPAHCTSPRSSNGASIFPSSKQQQPHDQPDKSYEQQLGDQPNHIRGAAVLQAARPHLRSSSSPPRTKEQQPHEQTAHIRGAAALCSTHWSEEESHTACTCPTSSSQVSGLSWSKEEQPCMQLTPIQRAAALQSTCPCPRNSSPTSNTPHQRNNSSVQPTPIQGTAST